MEVMVGKRFSRLRTRFGASLLSFYAVVGPSRKMTPIANEWRIEESMPTTIEGIAVQAGPG